MAVSEYTGVVPDPATQTQSQLDAAATAWATWLTEQAPNINAAVSAADASDSSAEAAKTAAEAARDQTQTYRDQTQTYRDGANLYATAASQAQTGAQTAQANAQQSAADAAGYASLAQATNPATPIRVNPNAINDDFTIASGYNGASVGPIEITLNTTMTVAHNSAWSVL